jgi:hypothetical protein
VQGAALSTVPLPRCCRSRREDCAHGGCQTVARWNVPMRRAHNNSTLYWSKVTTSPSPSKQTQSAREPGSARKSNQIDSCCTYCASPLVLLIRPGLSSRETNTPYIAHPASLLLSLPKSRQDYRSSTPPLRCLRSLI